MNDEMRFKELANSGIYSDGKEIWILPEGIRPSTAEWRLLGHFGDYHDGEMRDRAEERADAHGYSLAAFDWNYIFRAIEESEDYQDWRAFRLS